MKSQENCAILKPPLQSKRGKLKISYGTQLLTIYYHCLQGRLSNCTMWKANRSVMVIFRIIYVNTYNPQTKAVRLRVQFSTHYKLIPNGVVCLLGRHSIYIVGGWHYYLYLDLPFHGDQVQSFAWSYDGKLIASSCKDKQIRILDPRANQCAQVSHNDTRRHLLHFSSRCLIKLLLCITKQLFMDFYFLIVPFVLLQETKGHHNIKDSRVIWLGCDSNLVLSSGFDMVFPFVLFAMWFYLVQFSSYMYTKWGGCFRGTLISDEAERNSSKRCQEFFVHAQD